MGRGADIRNALAALMTVGAGGPAFGVMDEHLARKPWPKVAIAPGPARARRRGNGGMNPACPACRVTLSRGLCLNRMCKEGEKNYA